MFNQCFAEAHKLNLSCVGEAGAGAREPSSGPRRNKLMCPMRLLGPVSSRPITSWQSRSGNLYKYYGSLVPAVSQGVHNVTERSAKLGRNGG